MSTTKTEIAVKQEKITKLLSTWRKRRVTIDKAVTAVEAGIKAVHEGTDDGVEMEDVATLLLLVKLYDKKLLRDIKKNKATLSKIQA